MSCCALKIHKMTKTLKSACSLGSFNKLIKTKWGYKGLTVAQKVKFSAQIFQRTFKP
jgi:hypothetical protein